MLTAARLREVLHYDPETGVFRWRMDRDRAGNAKAGDIAGRIASTGYRQIRVDNRLYKAHRLAFLYMTGEWPEQHVDHRDGDRLNNAWSNLREATPSQNGANRGATKRNKLGVKGVYRNHDGKFKASICLDGEQVYLGTFDTPAEAASIYAVAAKDMHGEFARVA